MVAAAWQPTGSLEELHATSLLPRLRPGVEMRSFSSYDRTGGNNDGFSGKYSALRIEDGNSVIAEMDGPGCIYRLWTTHSIGEEPGLLERKGEHIRIYLNGRAEPALDVPLEDLFDGSLAHFPKPMAGEGIGGYYSYVPIAYRESCKVVVEGKGVRFYQINYATFPSAEGVDDFAVEVTEAERAALDKAVAFWSDPLGHVANSAKKQSISVKHEPGSGNDYRVSGEGQRGFLIAGVTLDGVPAAAIRWTDIEFDFEEAGAENLRVPLSLYFGQCFGPAPYASLLFGVKDGVYYNLTPIVCAGACTIRLIGDAPFEGTVGVYTAELGAPIEELGRLAAQVNASLPTRPGVLHPFLKQNGAGHYVGTYLVTEGPKGLPYWLEGDDVWTIGGEMRIHGTGSEDYFNCGWYALEGRLNGPASKPSHGFPIYGETSDSMRAAAYRWHLSDPAPFETTIDVGIEHGGENDKVADYRSIAYYYVAR
jgi:hypothetical protein